MKSEIRNVVYGIVISTGTNIVNCTKYGLSYCAHEYEILFRIQHAQLHKSLQTFLFGFPKQCRADNVHLEEPNTQTTYYTSGRQARRVGGTPHGTPRGTPLFELKK